MQRLVIAQGSEKPSGEGMIKIADQTPGQDHARNDRHTEIGRQTIAFNLAPTVNLVALTVGAKIKFTLTGSADGTYI
jgi:hypothetical protein